MLKFTVYAPTVNQDATDELLMRLRIVGFGGGGLTVTPGVGQWYDGDAVVVKEPVNVITVLAPYMGGASRSSVEHALETFKLVACQDEVLFTVEEVEAVTL